MTTATGQFFLNQFLLFRQLVQCPLCRFQSRFAGKFAADCLLHLILRSKASLRADALHFFADIFAYELLFHLELN